MVRNYQNILRWRWKLQVELKQIKSGFSHLEVYGVLVSPKATIIQVDSHKVLDIINAEIETKKTRTGVPYKEIISCKVFDADPDPEIMQDYVIRMNARFEKKSIEELSEIQKEGIEDYKYFMKSQPMPSVKESQNQPEYKTIKINGAEFFDIVEAENRREDLRIIATPNQKRVIAEYEEIVLTPTMNDFINSLKDQSFIKK